MASSKLRVTTVSLLVLTACAEKQAGPTLPISENLAPAVASPSTTAFSPVGNGTSAYQDPGIMAPMRELNPDETLTDDSRPRVSSHAFRPATNRPPVASVPLPAEEAAPASPSGLTDGQIVRITETQRAAEVAEAQLAADRSEDARVKDFAQRVIDDNQRLKQRDAALAKSARIVPAESSVSADLRVKASQELSNVELAEPRVFDRAFVDAQVERKQEMLELLNARLIPDATRPELRSELEKARLVVDRQLEEARGLQQALGSANLE
jgi:putative membrane protein